MRLKEGHEGGEEGLYEGKYKGRQGRAAGRTDYRKEGLYGYMKEGRINGGRANKWKEGWIDGRMDG